jgi:type I pantothenate kinase
VDEVTESQLDPYEDFTRVEWSSLRASTPLSLTETDLAALRGMGEPMPISEVEDVYLPLSRLLNLHVVARLLHRESPALLVAVVQSCFR